MQALEAQTEPGSICHRKIITQLAYVYGNWASFHAANAEKKKFYEDCCLEWIDCCFKNGVTKRPHLYNYMGDIMCDRENFEKALIAYTQAITLKPKDYWAYRGVANVYFIQDAKLC